MKSIFTLGRRHGSKKWEVALDDSATDSAHRRAVKPFRATRKHPLYAEVRAVRTVRRFKFEPAAQKPQEPAKPKPILQKIAEVVSPKRGRPRKAAGAFAQRLAAKQTA